MPVKKLSADRYRCLLNSIECARSNTQIEVVKLHEKGLITDIELESINHRVMKYYQVDIDRAIYRRDNQGKRNG